MNASKSITALLRFAVIAETSKSPAKRQSFKMHAGKARKRLAALNQDSKDFKSGIKKNN